MAHKPLRGPRRASNLALPFVVTAAAACTIKPASETPQTRQGPDGKRPTVKGEAPANQSNTNEEANKPIVISNPPAPAVKPQTMTTNPPPPGALPPAPRSNGKMYVTEDGKCMWSSTVRCPPNTMCNPPPPYEVMCEPNEEK